MTYVRTGWKCQYTPGVSRVAISWPNNPPDHRKAKRGNLREEEKSEKSIQNGMKENAKKNE